MIFGGHDDTKFDELRETFIFNVSSKTISQGPNLPVPVLPENPGYTLNSHANFYFLGNVSTIFRFNKKEDNRKWVKLDFNLSVF